MFWTQCLKDTLHIYCDPEQDKVVTEHEWMHNDFQLMHNDVHYQ